MTESKRVVVTGLGCISPLGNTVAETWEKGSQGQSGINRIEKFDPSEMRCQIAGEVRNFELPDLVPPKEAKKMDLFIHYAIAATQEALQDSPPPSLLPRASSTQEDLQDPPPPS